MELRLFTTQSCTQCPIVKQALDSKGIEYTTIDANEEPELAGEFQIMAVPTLLDHKGNKYSGVQQCMGLINQI